MQSNDPGWPRLRGVEKPAVDFDGRLGQDNDADHTVVLIIPRSQGTALGLLHDEAA
jgi:chemotaxis signal transduction protein